MSPEEISSKSLELIVEPVFEDSPTAADLPSSKQVRFCLLFFVLIYQLMTRTRTLMRIRPFIRVHQPSFHPLLRQNA